jgi:hypothetical protein
VCKISYGQATHVITIAVAYVASIYRFDSYCLRRNTHYLLAILHKRTILCYFCYHLMDQTNVAKANQVNQQAISLSDFIVCTHCMKFISIH